MPNNYKKSKGLKEGKLSKLMKTPLRALAKLKDLYVESMAGCSGGHFEIVAAGMSMGCSPAAMTVVPRRFSAGDSDDRSRELLRAASARLKKSPASPGRCSPAKETAKLPKSRSVGFARIDEDEPYELGVVHVCPRSKSHALTGK